MVLMNISPGSFQNASLYTIAGFVLLILIQRFFLKRGKGLGHIPGPTYAAYTNLPLQYAVISGSRMSHIHNLHRTWGSIVRISPTEVSVVDPEACHIIHRAGSGYRKSDWYTRFSNKPVRFMFDMIDPKEHAVRRRLFARAFTKTEIRTKWESVVKGKAELAVKKMDEEMCRGETEIIKWWFFMATDIGTRLMFGESFRTLENGQVSDYIRVLQTAAKGGAIADELPLVAFIGKLIPHPTTRELFMAGDYLDSYGKKVITNCKLPGSDKSSIFTQLEADSRNQLGDGKGAPRLSELDLSIEAASFLLAGTDTTAFTLTCLVCAVLKQVAVQSALAEEVGRLEDNFTDAQLEELPFLEAVINETLRLYGPAAGSLPRVVPKGGAHLGGYFVPEDTTVSTQSWTLHRDATLWSDPERFDPYRWIGADSCHSAKRGFVPFGAGSRTCLGLHLAMMELRLATALFFRKFPFAKLSPSCASKKLEFENYFLVKPKGRWTIMHH